MEREILRSHFGMLLSNTDNEHHLKCDVRLDNLKTPKTIGMYQDIKTNNIFFYINGDCIVEFDDIDTDMLISIYLTLLKQNINN